MTDTMFTRTALTEAAKKAGVTTDQARIILEAAGVIVQPEKPALPTDPESVIIATEVRGVKGEWRLFLDQDGEWYSAERVEGHHWYHQPEHITAWTEAVVLPGTELEAVRAAQDTLEELAKMGVAESDQGSVLEMAARLAVHGIDSDEVDRMVKQHYSTAQYAAPAEGELIDPDDVREGDRVRVVLDNGDEATFTVRNVTVRYLHSRDYGYSLDSIRAIHLLDREEA